MTLAENKYCTEKITMYKNDDKPLHQSNMKFHIFIASKGVAVIFYRFC